MDRTTPEPPRHSMRPAQPLHEDVRWLLITGAAFVVSLLFLGLLYWLYRATGPHPGVLLALRRLRYYARWLLPGL